MELDDAYANQAHIPDGASYGPRWVADAAAFRQGARARLDLAYGQRKREALDLFLPRGAAQGLVVFVHGGFWRMLDRSYWSHFAGGAVARGWAVAMPSYDLCPDMRIADITRQIARAVTYAAAQVDGPVRLTGHSAGGHLVARMLAPGMLGDGVAARIAGVVPVSPLSDLRPLIHTAMNDDFRLDDAAARAESPVFQPAPKAPVTVWVGAEERPAFLDQARWLADAWGCHHVVAPGRHHFDVLDPLREPDSVMTDTLLAS